MAVTFRDITLITIYAPSGSARRHDRELFYSSELPYVLPIGTPHIVLAGDFNCTLEQGDTTGTVNRCRALTVLIHGLALRDAWQKSSAHPGYTHYSSAEASRIDRIYVTGDLLQRKKGMETIATAFTNHLAVSLHITTNVPLVRRGRGIWIMDTDMLAKHNIHEQIKTMGTVPTPETILPQ
jgi:exonuclease III